MLLVLVSEELCSFRREVMERLDVLGPDEDEGYNSNVVQVFQIEVINKIIKCQLGAEVESISKCLGIQVSLCNTIHNQNCSCSPSLHGVLVGAAFVTPSIIKTVAAVPVCMVFWLETVWFHTM